MEKTLGQIACEAISGADGWDGCASVPGLNAMWEAAAQAVADKAVAAEREAWNNKLSDACQSDFENGAKWLNVRAADEFKAKFPRLWDLINGK